MTVTRLGLGLAAAALTISALSGCSTIADVRKITDAATSAVQQIQDGTGATGDVLTADGLDKRSPRSRRRSAPPPMQVVKVTLIPTTATVQAIDPNAPTELNQWTYTAGHVGASRPVDYDDDAEALRQNLFVLTDVPRAPSSPRSTEPSPPAVSPTARCSPSSSTATCPSMTTCAFSSTSRVTGATSRSAPTPGGDTSPTSSDPASVAGMTSRHAFGDLDRYLELPRVAGLAVSPDAPGWSPPSARSTTIAPNSSRRYGNWIRRGGSFPRGV